MQEISEHDVDIEMQIEKTKEPEKCEEQADTRKIIKLPSPYCFNTDGLLSRNGKLLLLLIVFNIIPLGIITSFDKRFYSDYKDYQTFVAAFFLIANILQLGSRIGLVKNRYRGLRTLLDLFYFLMAILFNIAGVVIAGVYETHGCAQRPHYWPHYPTTRSWNWRSPYYHHNTRSSWHRIHPRYTESRRWRWYSCYEGRSATCAVFFGLCCFIYLYFFMMSYKIFSKNYKIVCEKQPSSMSRQQNKTQS